MIAIVNSGGGCCTNLRSYCRYYEHKRGNATSSYVSIIIISTLAWIANAISNRFLKRLVTLLLQQMMICLMRVSPDLFIISSLFDQAERLSNDALPPFNIFAVTLSVSCHATARQSMRRNEV